MSQKISEIEALKGIDEFFGQLSDEERQRIFQFISSKYNLAVKTVKENSYNDNSQEALSSLSLKQFVANKKPKGFYEQIACLAYYIEKVQGLESFGTVEISTANTEARATKIPNTSLYLGDTVSKYHFLSSIGGGKKALTARGEAVVEALPDRDAVKLALESNPIKKKVTNKKKKISKK